LAVLGLLAAAPAQSEEAETEEGERCRLRHGDLDRAKVASAGTALDSGFVAVIRRVTSPTKYVLATVGAFAVRLK
jgi:hypothetical protein